MMASLIRRSLGLTTVLCWRHPPKKPPLAFFCSDAVATRCYELNRVPSLIEGCDYEHWLVVMESPRGYPDRKEIVESYVNTLAVALGSKDEAKRSIYSVSTKYYYAFGCKVPEILTYRIKTLPSVRWVFPDSYVGDGYGGEPFVNGEVVPYDEKYHEDWIQDRDNEKGEGVAGTKKPRRKRKKKLLQSNT